jgi:osmotically-inducible protein OsmY
MKQKSLLQRALVSAALTGLLATGSISLLAGAQESSKPAQPDNTKVNKRDRHNGAATADSAKNNSGDRQLMQTIRKAVMDDKSLSTYAHNVKIIAQNGKVTLKGPVRSEEEKKAIEEKAIEAAGSGNVMNQLTVKGESSARKKRDKTS